MNSVSIQTEVFDVGEEIRQLAGRDTALGAVVSFVGLVRDHNEVGGAPAAVEALTLEHYPGMAEKALQRIGRQASERWELQAVRIVHRVGELSVGDPIVLVLTAAAHRQAAFDACSYLMDRLKTGVPLWKKESLSDGRERWLDARDSDVETMRRHFAAG